MLYKHKGIIKRFRNNDSKYMITISKVNEDELRTLENDFTQLRTDLADSQAENDRLKDELIIARKWAALWKWATKEFRTTEIISFNAFKYTSARVEEAEQERDALKCCGNCHGCTSDQIKSDKYDPCEFWTNRNNKNKQQGVKNDTGKNRNNHN